MSQKNKSNLNGEIAVIGERELVMGYRLLGIDDTFVVNNNDEALKAMESVFSSKKFAMVIASQFVRDSLPTLFKNKVDASLEPLVIFMPSLEGTVQEESISTLAKRVLGISIKY